MTDILLLSLGTTVGLRAGDEALASLIREAGATVEIAQVQLGATAALRRAYPVTDLVEAASARRTLARALPQVAPRAVIFSSTTSSLLANDPGVPYAVRIDAPARLNRPGARNALQHALERRRMRAARLVLPFSRIAADALPRGAAPAVVLPQPIESSDAALDGGRGGGEPAVVLPQPIESSGTREPSDTREPLVVAYTPDPKAKGLDLAVAAWARAGLAGAEPSWSGSGVHGTDTGVHGANSDASERAVRGATRMEVFGISPELARRHLARHGIPEPPGVVWRGRVTAAEFREALRQAHVFLTAARWEDFGFAQLEALADGALLVCGATGGPFEALAHARELSGALCTTDLQPESLAAALRCAFEMPDADAARYRAAAQERIAAYRPEAVRAIIAERVLPTLLG